MGNEFRARRLRIAGRTIVAHHTPGCPAPLPLYSVHARAHMPRAHMPRARQTLWRRDALLSPFRKAGTIALDPAAPRSQPATPGALALLEVTQPAPAPAPLPTAARRTILVVEDDPLTAGVVRTALELEGDPDWSITVAGEGMRALELAAGSPPDVVLLDVRLPGLDGGEVYRRLRASHPTGRMRVLFITAGTSLDLYQRGIDDGVLLRKPFNVQELVGLVRQLLAP
jgi:CheY-like chemotaxis protein